MLSTNWLLCACTDVTEATSVACQAQGVCVAVGNRPGRIEQRANKRRPKVLKLMTITRREFQAALAALG